jgi:glycosyltransferase involved in cell wall biosynthesis
MAHDFAFLDFGEHFTWRQRVLSRMQTWHTIRLASHVVAVSEATKAHLTRRFRMDPSRVSVSLEGCSPQFREVEDAEALEALRDRLELPERYVLYVGRIQPRKNLVRLMEAFARVCREHPELPHHLVMAGGKGWLYDGIYTAAEKSPVCDRIRFLGYVEEADLPLLMNGADVFALVSLWEGFGLPVIEAMACGTPVVTSNCSSLPEVAGDAALLVNPKDVNGIAAALTRLLTDGALRASCVEKGRAQAARFTWEHTAEAIVEAARKAAGGN